MRGGCASTSFLVFSKGEPCGDRHTVLPWGQKAGPKAPWEGGMVGTGPPLSPPLNPQALWGPIPWHQGIWNLHTVPSGI